MEEELIHFRLNDLSIADFEACPIWCPYRYPWELEELAGWGGNGKKVQTKILAAVTREHIHPHYSIPPKLPVGRRDLFFVTVDIMLPDDKINFFGYLVFSDGEPTTLCVFHHNEEFSFYSDPSEPDENAEEMLRMTGDSISKPLVFALTPRQCPPDVVIPSVFVVE